MIWIDSLYWLQSYLQKEKCLPILYFLPILVYNAMFYKELLT